MMMKIVQLFGKGVCPKCGKGDVFSNLGNILKFSSPKMNESCPICGYIYERESGYFLGAFYISYAISVGELLVVYFITQFFTKNVWEIISMMFIVLLLMININFRVSRLIWIYIFNK